MEADYMEKTSNPLAIMSEFSIETLKNKINDIAHEIISKENFNDLSKSSNVSTGQLQHVITSKI